MQLERVCWNHCSWSWSVCVGISASSAHHLEILMAFSTVRIEFACSAQHRHRHTPHTGRDKRRRCGQAPVSSFRPQYISSLTQGPHTLAAQPHTMPHTLVGGDVSGAAEEVESQFHSHATHARSHTHRECHIRRSGPHVTLASHKRIFRFFCCCCSQIH
jgi:hypothetical protein